MDNAVFPVEKNTTFIPEGFKCWSLDLSSPEFQNLVFAGCNSIILVDCPEGWRISRNADSEERHLDLFFIESGCLEICTKNRSISAKPGDILQVVSWDDRYLMETAPGRHIYVRFNNPECYPNFITQGKQSNNVVEQFFHYSKTLLYRDNNLSNDTAYRQSLAQLVHILLQRELQCDSVYCTGDIQKLQHILHDSQRRNFEALPIARQMGMSFSKFRNFCLRNFGKSPRYVIEDALMARARGALTYTPLTIEEIAEQLGFSDRFAFSKAFARHHHTTPAAYRKCGNR